MVDLIHSRNAETAMCVMSAVTPAITRQWPDIHSQVWPREDLGELQRILRKLDEMDKKFGAKDCAEDAPKQAFLEQLDARVKAIESAAQEAGWIDIGWLAEVRKGADY